VWLFILTRQKYLAVWHSLRALLQRKMPLSGPATFVVADVTRNYSAEEHHHLLNRRYSRVILKLGQIR